MKIVLYALIAFLFCGIALAGDLNYDPFVKQGLSNPFAAASVNDPFEGSKRHQDVFAEPARTKKQVPACPGCTCGCQEGEECSCSKMAAKKKVVKKKVATNGDGGYYKTFCGPNECSQVWVSTTTRSYSEPTYYYQSSGYGGGGGCGAGGCGTSGGGRRGLFGRWR